MTICKYYECSILEDILQSIKCRLSIIVYNSEIIKYSCIRIINTYIMFFNAAGYNRIINFRFNVKYNCEDLYFLMIEYCKIVNLKIMKGVACLVNIVGIYLTLYKYQYIFN